MSTSKKMEDDLEKNGKINGRRPKKKWKMTMILFISISGGHQQMNS